MGDRVGDRREGYGVGMYHGDDGPLLPLGRQLR
jgi:hypothetical protein